jgi:hypothetical protein
VIEEYYSVYVVNADTLPDDSVRSIEAMKYPIGWFGRIVGRQMAWMYNSLFKLAERSTRKAGNPVPPLPKFVLMHNIETLDGWVRQEV